MKVVEETGEIILRDVPTTNWVYGFSFLSVALLVCAPIFLNTSFRKPSGIMLMFCLLLAGFCFYWAAEKLSAPIIVTHVSAAEQIVRVTKTKFALIKMTEAYPFAQIKRFEMVERTPDRTLLYFNTMILEDDSYIDLEASGFATQTNRISSKLNEFLKAHRTPQDKRRKERQNR